LISSSERRFPANPFLESPLPRFSPLLISLGISSPLLRERTPTRPSLLKVHPTPKVNIVSNWCPLFNSSSWQRSQPSPVARVSSFAMVFSRLSRTSRSPLSQISLIFRFLWLPYSHLAVFFPQFHFHVSETRYPKEPHFPLDCFGGFFPRLMVLPILPPVLFDVPFELILLILTTFGEALSTSALNLGCLHLAKNF